MTNHEDEVPRANPQHVAWLNEGVECWNRRRREEAFAPELAGVVLGEGAYADLLFENGWYTKLSSLDNLNGLNLSNANLRSSDLSGGVFRFTDFSASDLTGASAEGADFRGADFRGATLRDFSASSAKFDRAIFQDPVLRGRSGIRVMASGTDLEQADFVNCDFSHAEFGASNLDGMNFSKCNLTGAHLSKVSLAGAFITESDLWHARLFDRSWTSTVQVPSKSIDSSRVESLRDLDDLLRHLRKVYAADLKFGGVKFYFRGETCDRLELRPTVMRDGLALFERDLLIGLKTEFPASFTGQDYAIDQLSIARHYGLPTRLLDVTRNALVGAFWSTGRCEFADSQSAKSGFEQAVGGRDRPHVHPDGKCDGRLHVFVLPRPVICTYDSDRVSIVANFAELPFVQQEYLLTKYEDEIRMDHLLAYSDASDWPRVSLEGSMTTLLHNIRREKPYFADRIDARDLFRVFVVEPRRSFARIRAQSGAFMLSAFHQRFEGREVAKNLVDANLYDHHVLTVPHAKKAELRDELDWFGISGQTLFADVESAADALTRRFRKWAGMIESPQYEVWRDEARAANGRLTVVP